MPGQGKEDSWISRTILQGSGRLISFNRVRTEKTLWTENPEEREVEIIQAEDEEKEAALILERLGSLLETNGTCFKDISILYRTNAQSRALEEERRLCYVGMTRAMERLYISYPRTYQGKKLRASQFLEEAFPEHAET